MSASKEDGIVFHHAVYEIPNFEFSALVGVGILDNSKKNQTLLFDDLKHFVMFIHL